MHDQYAVTGATGLLGSEFVRQLQASGKHVTSLSRRELDVSQGIESITKHIKKSQCNKLIHCAANTNVELCEQSPDDCYQSNYLMTEVIANICHQEDIKLIFISSTGIYGTYKKEPYIETDDIRTTTHYHHSKHLAEQSIQSMCHDFLIIRTGWLFGKTQNRQKDFIRNRIDEANHSNGVIYANDKQYGNPSYTMDVVARIIDLINDDHCGIYNCVNRGVATRHEYISEIIRQASLTVDVKTYMGRYPRLAQVSDNESALNYKMDLLGYPPLRGWKVALKDYMSCLHEE